MIVAMPIVGVVQVAIDEIVNVIAMGHGWMATIGAMNM
jgi:hypothetical protein